MRPTTATHDNVFDFQALLHPPQRRRDAPMPHAGREAGDPRILGF